ncbi:MAG: hypothetical protein IJ705_00025, partial [Oscillospiraceae bacterium]|nr:hypothetical protein [Oscillospiraceae bacterium]
IVPLRSCRAFVRNDGQREVSIALFDYDWAVTGADTELPDRGEPPGPYGDAPKADGLSFPMDFDHDGTQERLLVTSHADGGGTWAALLAENGETIAELHTAHAGWERWFKYISPEGGDYLLRCRPAMGTGIGAYSYELLDASDGERRVVQAGSVEFSVAPDEIMLPAEEMASFAEELNALLEHSTLLVSTVGGKLVLGPAAGTGYLESYSFMDRELGLTEPLPLREKIARYDALLQTVRDG